VRGCGAGRGLEGVGALENVSGTSQWIAEITLAADSRIAVDGPGDTLTLTGGVHGPGGLEKTGAGTLVLSSTINNYSGATTVNAGTLALSGSGSIASSSKVDVANAAGTFNISGTTSGATITSLAGVANSHVTLGSKPLTLSNANDPYAGIIQGTGGLALTAGTETLSGANTYDGVTQVLGGTLSIRNGAALGSTTNGTTVGPGATLQLDGDPTTIGASITVAEPLLGIFGTGVNGNGAIRNLTGNNTLSGPIALTDPNVRIGVDAGTQLTISGPIFSAGGIEKTGTGTLVLATDNTYDGTTTVSAGILNIRSAGALP